jgi:carbon starvation protein
VIINRGKGKYAWVTGLPLAWLATVTLTAGTEKIFSSDPRLGFLAHAAQTAAAPHTESTTRLIFNDYLDTAVAAFFMASFVLILGYSMRDWYRAFKHRRPVIDTEIPFQPRTAFVKE